MFYFLIRSPDSDPRNCSVKKIIVRADGVIIDFNNNASDNWEDAVERFGGWRATAEYYIHHLGDEFMYQEDGVQIFPLPSQECEDIIRGDYEYILM